MRSGLLPAALLVVLASGLAGGCGSGGERVLATAGGRRITAADLEAAARRLPYIALDPSPQAKRRVLDELINRALLVDEARRRGLGRGPEFAQAREQARIQVLPQVLYERVVGGRVRVSDGEARAIWGMQDHEWRLSQIFVLSDAEARSAEARLRRGVPFAEVARTMSRDQGSAMRGGDLGYVTAGQIPSEIERVVARLPKGRWAGPLPTPMGSYFVQVTDRRARPQDPYEEIGPTIRSVLQQRKERQLVLQYVTRVKQRYGLRRDEAGYALLAAKFQNRPVEELMAAGGDPRRLGFTNQDLAHPLVTYDGGAYTIRDFFTDLNDTNTLERPAGNDDAALRLYVDDRTVSRLLLRDAQSRGIDREDETLRQLRDREDSYLVNRYYEQVIVPSAQVTPAEREQARAAAGRASGDSAAVGAGEAEEKLFELKRRQVLEDTLARLRREHPPIIDEKALASVPWPVVPKENA